MTTPRPLCNVTVLDFTRVLSGPYCTVLMADLGADVIKIESAEGDDYRHIGPFVGGESALFDALNRGKRSIALDLRTPGAIATIHRLARRADVLVENFRPGVMDRLGLGWESLSAINPRLIYVSISGFGHTGPSVQAPAYDIIVQALSGIMHVTGDPDGPPTMIGEAIGDVAAGLFAAWGTAIALFDRESTGLGRHLDLAMFDALLAFMPTLAARHLLAGEEPGRVGNRHPLSAPFGVYQAGDGHFAVAVLNDRLFARFAEVIARPELASDARFSSDAQRFRHESALAEAIEGWAAQRTAADAVAALSSAGVPAATIASLTEAWQSQQARERGLWSVVAHETRGELRVPEQPVHFSGVPRGVRCRAPDSTSTPASSLETVSRSRRIVNDLTDEERAIIAAVDRFAREVLAPRAAEIDAAESFATLHLPALAELGVMGLNLPERWGGAGISPLALYPAVELIAGACGSTASMVTAHYLATDAILIAGDHDQCERALPRAAAGQWLGSFALTEPQAGSNPAEMRCTAKRDGDRYRLSGVKHFISNAGAADFIVVFATTDNAAGARGISTFLVETADLQGLSVSPQQPMMGLRGGHVFEVHFDCTIPATHRLGPEGTGFATALRVLDNGRIEVAAQATGIAQVALDAALRWARERQVGGQAIAEFQGLQWMLADMATQLAAARALSLNAAHRRARGERFSAVASMAKLFATEAAFKIADQALQIHGGYGYSRDLPLERYLRDLRVFRIYEGSSEIQRNIIARNLLKP